MGTLELQGVIRELKGLELTEALQSQTEVAPAKTGDKKPAMPPPALPPKPSVWEHQPPTVE
eukprot:794143-Rhodomonas_salina.1